MLRTNLSTRPFYNMRAVQVTLGAFGVLVLAITLFNAFELIRQGTRQRSLGAREVEAQAEAARLRNDAVRIRSQINPKELEMVAASGMSVRPFVDKTGGHSATVEFDPYFANSIEQLLEPWLPFVFAINSVSRAMGERDLYPFVIAPPVIKKLGFVHDLIHGNRVLQKPGRTRLPNSPPAR